MCGVSTYVGETRRSVCTYAEVVHLQPYSYSSSHIPKPQEKKEKKQRIIHNKDRPQLQSRQVSSSYQRRVHRADSD